MLQDIDGVLHGVAGGGEGVRGCKCACIHVGDEACNMFTVGDYLSQEDVIVHAKMGNILIINFIKSNIYRQLSPPSPPLFSPLLPSTLTSDFMYAAVPLVLAMMM